MHSKKHRHFSDAELQEIEAFFNAKRKKELERISDSMLEFHTESNFKSLLKNDNA
jgi:hypothetical protein